MTAVADVFRTEWPRLVATLVRDVRDLGMAEDAAQDAFVEATTRWAADGVPDRPGAWLVTTARRKLIDRYRRAARFDERLPALAAAAEFETPHATDESVLDDQLSLLLGCCHPALAPEAQVALTLRAVAGLSTTQIASAFLVSEATMTRRLTRSKTKIREARIPFDPPSVATLNERLPSVCGVIYSIFTEGHSSATDAALVRGDLCDEAIWLAELLVSLVPNDPEVAGLLALVLLTDARRAARVDQHGPVLLADQDRSKWDRATIARGLAELARAHSFGQGGLFQFHAAIAALHATAPSFEATDWAGVLRLYDAMLRRHPTVIVAMNRAIALGQLDGPRASLDALDAIPLADDLHGDIAGSVHFHTARAEALAALGERASSRRAFARAIELCRNEAERAQLRHRSDHGR